MIDENTWAIMDDNGIIFTGSEWGMKEILHRKREMVYRDNDIKGDLLLVEIHETHK